VTLHKFDYLRIGFIIGVAVGMVIMGAIWFGVEGYQPDLPPLEILK